MQVLGIRVDNLSIKQAQEQARLFLTNNKQNLIFTPNPEFLVKAQADQYFRTVLNTGDMNLCDGFGLHLASGAPRITGADFMLDICKIAAENEQGIFLLGGMPGAAEKTAEKLSKQIPGLKIAGWEEGPRMGENFQFPISNFQSSHNFQFPISQSTIQPINYSTGLKFNSAENTKIIDKITTSGATILFVAFGMGKQEKWIYENLAKMPNIKIAMGVGGAFDYISGLIPRAPLFLRQIGLEWMYRVIVQPKRLFRILNATLVFSWLVIKSRINDK